MSFLGRIRPPFAIDSADIIDGSVTDAKLANAKLNLTGGTLSGALTISSSSTLQLTSTVASIFFDDLASDGLGFKRITTNDGDGNWTFRACNFVNGSSVNVFAKTGDGAATITMNHEIQNGEIILSTADIGVADTIYVEKTRVRLNTSGITFRTNAGDRFAIDNTGRLTATTANYEDLVTTDDDIPNRKFITDIVSNKNILINGGFDIWQRGTSFALSASNLYTTDRWIGAVAAGTVATVSQIATSASGKNAFFGLRAQRTVGDTGIAIVLVQVIESINIVPLQGKTMTLSFSALKGANYSPAADALNVQFRTGTGIDEGNGGATGGGWTGFEQTTLNSNVTLTGSIQRFSFTFTVPVGAREAAVVFSASTLGTAGADDFFDLHNIQLEVGSAATEFEVTDVGTELARAQRYYEKSESEILFQQDVSNGSTYVTMAHFRTTKRATPSITTAAGVSFFNFASAAPTASKIGVNQFAGELLANGTGSTGLYSWTWTADAEL